MALEHTYDTGWMSMDNAIRDFNQNRHNIEQMFGHKIQVHSIYKFWFLGTYQVKFSLLSETTEPRLTNVVALRSADDVYDKN